MVTTANHSSAVGFQLNSAPANFDPKRDLAPGLFEFLQTLHAEFTPRQQDLAAKRKQVLAESLAGKRPEHLKPSEATQGDWHIELPKWCEDQRNQMTGPADEAELVVKMLNSGAPGVMLDLEDSIVNQWDHELLGMQNVLKALRGELTYQDKKKNKEVAINDSKTVIWTRARGLHLNQAGVMPEVMSASLFDVASLAFQVDPAKLKHNLCIYIPKSESAEEALWWRDLFQKIAAMRGWPKDYIKCMALVVPPRGFSDGGVSLQLARSHPWVEPRPLGLHGEPDSLQP